ncbi:hypothetical protein AVEN_264837-1 [Araneus ventricosus]|uniref:Uncharacterized protein n=1 Tax=Araneus ventricosus TaxID=182803 RepID=A0A4Y2DZE2_ARAVE|nr:hypothetical protein AVEN_264837-1 [Araneus ventricosus]
MIYFSRPYRTLPLLESHGADVARTLSHHVGDTWRPPLPPRDPSNPESRLPSKQERRRKGSSVRVTSSKPNFNPAALVFALELLFTAFSFLTVLF